MNITFTVYGDPQPQGSTRAFVPKGWKRAIVTSTNKKLKPWRQEVAAMAREAMIAADTLMVKKPQAVEVQATFYFSRPKSAKKGECLKTTKPDVDKLARGLGDALTGITYQDDSQIAMLYLQKRLHDTPRTEVRVTSL